MSWRKSRQKLLSTIATRQGIIPPATNGHRAVARLVALGAAHATNSGEASGTPRRAKDLGWTTFPARTDAKTEWSWPTPESIFTRKEITERYGPTVAELFKLRQFDECVEALPAEHAPEFKSALLAQMDKPLPAINAAKPGLTGPTAPQRALATVLSLDVRSQRESEANSKNVDPFLVHALIYAKSRITTTWPSVAL